MKAKQRTLSAIILLAAFAVSATSSTIASTDSDSVDALVEGNRAFAVKMYQELVEGGDNLFFSPYSISSALGMTYAGARENTAKEMAAALDFELTQQELHPAFKKLNQELMTAAGKTDQKLSIANGLCLTGGDLSKDFKALLKNNYDAEFFSGGLDKINGWVKQKTEGKIEKILEQLDPNSVCVLLNAIYFKGTWKSQFKKDYTHEAPFKVSLTKEVQVPLMYQRGMYRLLSKETFQAATMPYKGESLSMVVLLPRDVDGLEAFEKELTAERLTGWLEELDKQHVQEIELLMPKFTLEIGVDLAGPCKDMGMKDAFEKTANFTGMGYPGKLWISQIKHKAFVDVNEEGTEAAAVTAVEMTNESVRSYPVFRADHPFLFLIRDNQRNSILFMGRMVDPSR